jgi:hypothetical protein
MNMKRWQVWLLWLLCFLMGLWLGHMVFGGCREDGQGDAPTITSEAPETPQMASNPPPEGKPISTPEMEEIRASMAAMPEVPECEPIAYAEIPLVETAQVWEGHQYQTARDAWMNEVIGPKLEWINRDTRYVRCMGMNVSDEDIRYFVELALEGGYDPRAWAVIAMAESSGVNNGNLYGFCGSWSGPGGGWREQTEYLHHMITTFYAQYIDISRPENILWFHHEGEALNGRDPYSIFYVANVMSWMEGF